MSPAILSQAHRIANGDSDLEQNILACNVLNYQNAKTKGRTLSIGEQVNFMKQRAGEFRSGKRNDFGNVGHTAKDVFNRRLYFQGDVEVHHINYVDDGDHDEKPESGKGSLTLFTSLKSTEDNCIFRVDLDNFLQTVSERERLIFLKRLEGYKQREIADIVKLDVQIIRRTLSFVGKQFVFYFNIRHAERFGLA